MENPRFRLAQWDAEEDTTRCACGRCNRFRSDSRRHRDALGRYLDENGYRSDREVSA